jgi:hypothetical protein
LKEKIEEYTKKNTVSTDDCIMIFNSLKRISVNDINKKSLLGFGFSLILLDVMKTDNLTAIQYALIPLSNLSMSFSSEDAKQLVKADAFGVFSKLFKRLTFITSTVPLPHYALDCGLQIVQYIVESYSPSGNILMSHELITDIIDMLPVALSLSTCAPLTEQIEWILIHIKYIVDSCGKSADNCKKLFNMDSVQIFLKLFEAINLKGGTMFDDAILEIVRLLKSYQ